MSVLSDNLLLGRLSGVTSRATVANLTGLNQAVTVDADGYNTVVFNLSGTYVAAVTLEASIDGGTSWFSVMGARTEAAGAESVSATLTNTVRTYLVNAVGYTHVRARVSTFTSGSLKITARGSGAAIQPATTLAGGTTAATQSTGSTSAAWLIAAAGIANNLTTTTSVNSAASTNAANVKTTAGTVYNIFIHNASAATRYVRFYNKASAPTVGTDVPVQVIAVPAGSSKEITSPVGIKYGTGIGYSITAAAGATDATAVAAGDVQLSFSWI